MAGDPRVPRWFEAALECQPEHLEIEVDSCPIHLRCWGEADRPGLVFVHGGGAHSGWWDHVAPFFAATHRVIALDLSGHGDSGYRGSYCFKTWAAEVLAAASATASPGPTSIVGHSMGGFVAAAAVTASSFELGGAIAIDSPLRDRAGENSRLRNHKRSAVGYPTRSAILSRFSTAPAQDVVLPYIADHIAEESVRRTDQGWMWKFDPVVFRDDRFTTEPTAAQVLRGLLAQTRCRVGFLRSEHGLVSPSMITQIRGELGDEGLFVELPDAGHHPMLDRPLALVTALRAILAAWSD